MHFRRLGRGIFVRARVHAHVHARVRAARSPSDLAHRDKDGTLEVARQALQGHLQLRVQLLPLCCLRPRLLCRHLRRMHFLTLGPKHRLEDCALRALVCELACHLDRSRRGLGELSTHT